MDRDSSLTDVHREDVRVDVLFSHLGHPDVAVHARIRRRLDEVDVTVGEKVLQSHFGVGKHCRLFVDQKRRQPVILEDVRELQQVRPFLLFVLEEELEHRQRIEHEPVERLAFEGVEQLVDRRREVGLAEHLALVEDHDVAGIDQFVESVEADRLGGGADVRFVLFEGDVHAALVVVRDARVEVLYPEDALAGTGVAGDENGRLLRDPAGEDRVEPRNARRNEF